MEDRDLMENELLVIKGVCDLYLHGAIEASTAEVHTAFKEALNTSLDIQNKIYCLMAEKGWYKMENAEQQKIDQAKQKFASRMLLNNKSVLGNVPKLICLIFYIIGKFSELPII